MGLDGRSASLKYLLSHILPGDLEWYDPNAVTTEGGKLVISFSNNPEHDLNYTSGMSPTQSPLKQSKELIFVLGMLTSWNKFCFTTGYIEVSVSIPGTVEAPGLWPAAWTLGNLVSLPS